ncbi:MAG: DUF3738 domain-containing protein [Planctomycetes bacterium]|nr:DUF3738 domain-containing protein [Planctomycetota bacterium]
MAKRARKHERGTPPKAAPTAKWRVWLRRGLAALLGLSGSGLAALSCYNIYAYWVFARPFADLGGRMKVELGPLFYYGSADVGLWLALVLMGCLLLCSTAMVVAAVKLFRMRELAFVRLRWCLGVFVAGLLIAGVLVAATFHWSLKGHAAAYVIVAGDPSGPRPAPAAESDSWGYTTSGKGWKFTAFSMDQLAEFLSSNLRVRVRNGTGLQGLYSFEIECSTGDFDTTGMGLRKLGIQLIPEARM